MVKKAKKVTKRRGVKPGTKRGKYNKSKPDKTFSMTKLIEAQLAINEERASKIQAYTPAPILTLCGQLEDAILLLENRISNSIAKINSLMGQL